MVGAAVCAIGHSRVGAVLGAILEVQEELKNAVSRALGAGLIDKEVLAFGAAVLVWYLW